MELLAWLFKFISFPLLIILLSQAIFSSFCFSKHLCPPDQNLPLLQFKNIFSSNNCSDQTPRKIPSWKEGTDCCLWDGVSCDNVTGNVIGLDLGDCNLCGSIDSNTSLFLLSHLQWLDLSYNSFSVSQIPSTISQLSGLKHLDLSYSDFSGSVPQEISHLSKLVSLDISFCDAGLLCDRNTLFMKNALMKRLVQNMTKLSVLFLDQVDMSDVSPHSLVNFSSSLTFLSLDSCILGEFHRGEEFPVNIFQSPNLEFLQLSGNPLTVHFPKSNWTSPLRFLEVGGTAFTGNIPNSIGGLKTLEYLDVGNSRGELPNSIGNLEYLKLLELSGNFIGSIPASIGNLTQLNQMGLFDTSFTGELPFSLGKLENLMDLDLYNSKFSGRIPNAFNNLTKLARINLSHNNFSGQLFSSFFNLTYLVEVDFSYNQFTGPIPSDINGHAVGIDHLDISNNLLKGTVPSWLFVSPSLTFLFLHCNQLDGHIEDFEANSSQLQYVDISNNKLQGQIPSLLFELDNLQSLNLSSNNMTGFLDLETISKLNNLRNLDLSYNNLSLSSSTNVSFTFPMFASLRLSSCNIREFPIFLKDSKFVYEIDLSNNQIYGQVPEWFLGLGSDSLGFLNLSHNSLTSLSQFPWNSLKYIFLSENKLSGQIPLSICKLSTVNILDLSNNNLNGTIPQCLRNLSSNSLSVLDLRKNKLHGAIPVEMFAQCKLLRTLGLNGNKLKGQLPHSLINCKTLEVLDVGNNRISGDFPHWLGTLPNLQVLVLRSNKFQGLIIYPKHKFPFPMLRIMDVSHNEFTGPLPALFFKNFKAMITEDQNQSELEYMVGEYYQEYMVEESYQYHMTVTMKGIDIELVRILSIFTTIDLSSNNLSGKIPDNTGKLKFLKGLNLSHNNLVGNIPLSFGSLANLEWLDLSSNKIAGKIPDKLLNLTSLEVLNLSYNNLEGQIPVGKQFNTFSNDSYIGNLGLCGVPLTKKCNKNNKQQPPSPSDNVLGLELEFGWKVVLMGYGCGMIFGLSMGYVVFSTGKPWWFVRLVEGYQTRRKLRRPNNGGRRHRRGN